jgi:hypothetical protein
MVRVFLFLLVFLATACSSLDTEYPDAVRIFQWYVYEYRAGSDETIGHALFTFDNPQNSPIRIEPPASIRINGAVPVFNPADSLPYTHVMTGRQDLGLFVYVNENSRQFTNIANLGNVRSIGFPVLSGPISTQEDCFLYWTGDAVAGGDLVSLEVEGAGGSIRLYGTREAGNDVLVVPAADLQALGAGQSSWTISRTSPVPMQDINPIGGRLFLRYTDGPAVVELE